MSLEYAKAAAPLEPPKFRLTKLITPEVFASGQGFAGSVDPKAETPGIPNAAGRGNSCQGSRAGPTSERGPGRTGWGCVGAAPESPQSPVATEPPRLCPLGQHHPPRSAGALANLGGAWDQGQETDGQQGFPRASEMVNFIHLGIQGILSSWNSADTPSPG